MSNFLIALIPLLLLGAWWLRGGGRLGDAYYHRLRIALPRVNPSLVTLTRIILAPVFFICLALTVFVSWWFGVAVLVIFWICWISDHADGEMARKYYLPSFFGDGFDPFADSINCLWMFAAFANVGMGDWRMVMCMVTRDLVTSFVRLLATHYQESIKASVWGKLKAMIQFFASTIMLHLMLYTGLTPSTLAIGWWLMLLTTLSTVASGVPYVIGAFQKNLFREFSAKLKPEFK